MPKCRVKRHSVTQPEDISYRLIPLTQGQNALVDAADFEWLSKWNWCAHWSETKNGFYAERGTSKDGAIAMHRVILECSKSEQGDHRNGNTLDNRRRNLRRCAHAQNVKNHCRYKNNKSGFIGVSMIRESQINPWRAVINIDKKRIHLGCFSDPQAAARAYDAAATRLFGAFASLNFPLSPGDGGGNSDAVSSAPHE